MDTIYRDVLSFWIQAISKYALVRKYQSSRLSLIKKLYITYLLYFSTIYSINYAGKLSHSPSLSARQGSV